ncbi:hypothetical protein FOA52_005276 [Chlamydomonas sp. UWO 241]|nr:hypothetical protein FOA52_005276 [Chlamydomonas sp. UWO 241]
MHRERPMPVAVPMCAAMMEGLTDADYKRLRDTVQVMVQHVRRMVFLANLLGWNGRPHDHATRKDDDKAMAYRNFIGNSTIAELQIKHDAEVRARDTVTAKFNDHVEDLRKAGRLPGNETDSARDVATCVGGRTNTRLYEYRPQVSIMMQYFKRPKNIKAFVDYFQTCNQELPLELLVNVDHPQDHAEWVAAAVDSGGLVVPVFSANLHEVRAYNRLASMARGDFLILMADDDYPPSNSSDRPDCSWIQNVARLFERWPDTGAIGLRSHTWCFHDAFLAQPVDPSLLFRDSALAMDVAFVPKVDMAPLAVRKSAWHYIGGMDESLTEPGECGILTDWDLCHRLWVSGWHVMAVPATLMRHDAEEGSTHRKDGTAERCWGIQSNVADNSMQQRLSRRLQAELCIVARELNLKHLERPPGRGCPYTQGCEPGTPGTCDPENCT